MDKIVYRCLSDLELLDMINPSNKDYDRIQNKNTFNYEPNTNYKHFFLFGNHADIYIPKYNGSLIGVYLIPEEVIEQTGYGFYYSVKSPNNKELDGLEVPIPEIIVKEENYDKNMLKNLYNTFNRERDTYRGRNIYEKLFDVDGEEYTYADIYYELICYLRFNYHMEMMEIANYLQNKDIKEEINKFYNEHFDKILKQKKDYQENQKRLK